MTCKKYTLFILLITLCAMVFGAHRKAAHDSASVIITLNNLSNQNRPVDSVLVIFDRCDLTGAGVVRQVFHPVKNQISILIPKGKYFVDVFCMGSAGRVHFGGTLKAKPNKDNQIMFKIKPSAIYIQGMAIMPAESIDPSNLSITHGHSSK